MTHELWSKQGMLAYLYERPLYCDRGRYHATIEVAIQHRSDADPWPRYYFNLQYAKEEVESYLRAKRVDIDGAEWREVP